MVASAGQTRECPGQPPGIRAGAATRMAAVRSRANAAAMTEGGAA